MCMCVSREQTRSGGDESFGDEIMVQVNIIIISIHNILYTECQKKKEKKNVDDSVNRHFSPYRLVYHAVLLVS